jgi:hypothetical protein
MDYRRIVNHVVVGVAVGVLAAAPADGEPCEQAKLLASDAAAYDDFGRSVSVSDAVAVVGACVDENNGQRTGSGYVYDMQCLLCAWDCQTTPDGEVTIPDFLAVLAQWGQAGTSCDFDGGGVSITDFLIMLGNWGACP